ncbi:hypothetical protein Pfo_006961, partial [Paulownia fortunei]
PIPSPPPSNGPHYPTFCILSSPHREQKKSVYPGYCSSFNTISATPHHRKEQSSPIRKEGLCQAWCYMIASMSNKLQRQYEGMAHAIDIHLHLKELYGEHTRQARYKVSRELFRCRMMEGSSVHDYGLKMIALIKRIELLWKDLVLQSLLPSFDSFVVNFNMHKMETSLAELINMLKIAKSTMKKEKPALLVGSSSQSKTKRLKKGKKKSSSKKAKGMKASGGAKKSSKPNDKCHYCGKPGHWKRNYRRVLVMTRSRELSREERIPRLGNGVKVATLAIGTVYLVSGDGKKDSFKLLSLCS